VESTDDLGEVGSRAGEQETNDETEQSEDGTEDLDDKNLDEPVQQSQHTWNVYMRGVSKQRTS